MSFIMTFVTCSKDDRDDEMIPIPNTVQFEQNLSSYGIYQGEIGEIIPSEDFQLFDISSTLYSNYSEKQRLIKLPDGKKILKEGVRTPSFPNGTVLVKTFYYYVDERDVSLGKQIVETRLLIKESDQWNVATYIWNDSQTEATLELNGFDTSVSWITATGENRAIDYHFPDQNECVSCHQFESEVVFLGPTLRNLNVEVVRDSTVVNQLEYLQSIGMLEDFDHSLINDIPDYKDLGESLSDRGRAYLDMNCAHCHNPSAWKKPAERGFDFRYEMPLSSTGISSTKDKIKEVVRNGEMPFLGVTEPHDEGVDLIVEYIESL